MSNRRSVPRYKLFFLHSVDLGLLLTDSSIATLQEWRATDSVFSKLLDIFDSTHTSAGCFHEPRLERDRVISRAKAAINLGGKNIWSSLFLDKFTPIAFVEQPQTPLSEAFSYPTDRDIPISLFVKDAPAQYAVAYQRCELRLFREGIVSMRFEFSCPEENQSPVLVEDLISLIAGLRKESFRGYHDKLRGVIRDWSRSNHGFARLGLQLHSPDAISDDLLARATNSHTMIFIETLVSEDGSTISPQKTQEDYHLLGILNQAHWFSKYGERYISTAFSQNIGYRSDEIYLTDHAATLVALADYWQAGNPLQYYIADLVLLTEFVVSKLSFLEFMVDLLQRDEDFKSSLLLEKTTQSTIERILATRNIFLAAEEGIDVHALVTHGFTRKFLAQLMSERGIEKQLATINRYIENMDSAVALKSQFEVAERGVSVDRQAVLVAVIALLATMACSIIAIVMQIVSEWQTIARLLGR